MASWPSNLILTIEYLQPQLVTTLMCDWWVVEMSMKDGWRSAREEIGVQYVMIDGMTLMHKLCADSLEYLLVVGNFIYMQYMRRCLLHCSTWLADAIATNQTNRFGRGIGPNFGPGMGPQY